MAATFFFALFYMSNPIVQLTTPMSYEYCVEAKTIALRERGGSYQRPNIVCLPVKRK